jgi:hypothetical protein
MPADQGIDSDGLDDLVRLIQFDKKRDLEKSAKRLTIRFEDFAEFIGIFDYVDLGYRHHFRRRELPSPLRPTADTLAGFKREASQDELRASAKKVSQFFKERQVLYGHMLCTPDLTLWHFFYFSERDTQRVSHWKGADGHPHHFVNHLWPQHSAERVWQAFNTGKDMSFSSLHIRFQQFEEEPFPGWAHE